MPLIPANQEAEVRGGGRSEPRSRHCTPAWVMSKTPSQKKKKKKKEKKRNRYLVNMKGNYSRDTTLPTPLASLGPYN